MSRVAGQPIQRHYEQISDHVVRLIGAIERCLVTNAFVPSRSIAIICKTALADQILRATRPKSQSLHAKFIRAIAISSRYRQLDATEELLKRSSRRLRASNRQTRMMARNSMKEASMNILIAVGHRQVHCLYAVSLSRHNFSDLVIG